MSTSDWLSTGLWNGELVRRADERVRAIGSDFPLLVEVLDAITADSSLAAKVESLAFVNDVRRGRLGGEWPEERQAIAAHTADSFQEEWPGMKHRLRGSSVVALAAAADAYMISVIVEFAAQRSATDHSAAWSAADRLLTAKRRARQSSSLGWLDACEHATLPPFIGAAIRAWAEEYGPHLDELVLVRNCLVHNAGLVDARIGRYVQTASGSRLALSDEMLKRYRRACFFLTDAVIPAL